MNDVTVLANDRINKLKSMLGEMVELGRMRSDYALEHFVVGQHDVPGRQRAQALAELQAMYFSLADVYDDMELAKLDLEEVKGDNQRAQIQRRQLERKIAGIQIHLIQRVKEIDCLLKLLEQMPRYTAEQLEAEEPIYWAARLSRQAFIAPRDPGGNLDAILQMVTIPGLKKPTTPVSPDVFLNGLGLDLKEIAAGLLHSKLITEQGAQFLIESGEKKEKKHRRR